MNNLLYIKLLASKGFVFGIPKEIKENFDCFFDLDNFSGTDVVDLGIEFLCLPNVKVIIDSDEGASFKTLLRLVHELKEKSEVEIEFIGSNIVLQNFLSSE